MVCPSVFDLPLLSSSPQELSLPLHGVSQGPLLQAGFCVSGTGFDELLSQGAPVNPAWGDCDKRKITPQSLVYPNVRFGLLVAAPLSQRPWGLPWQILKPSCRDGACEVLMAVQVDCGFPSLAHHHACFLSPCRPLPAYPDPCHQ